MSKFLVGNTRGFYAEKNSKEHQAMKLEIALQRNRRNSAGLYRKIQRLKKRNKDVPVSYENDLKRLNKTIDSDYKKVVKLWKEVHKESLKGL